MDFDFTICPLSELKDDGGKVLRARLVASPSLGSLTTSAVQQNYALMPTGGLTSAIGSYEYDSSRIKKFTGVLAIRPYSALHAQIVPMPISLEQLETNQLAIDTKAGLVHCGAGLTFTQINAALAEHVHSNAKVLIDLTSIDSAFVGGVIATGAMGPLRQRPSRTLSAVCLHNGTDSLVLGEDQLDQVEGLQGWTGLIGAASFRYYLLPQYQFGLALPVQSSDIDTIADFINYLAPWTKLTLPQAGQNLTDLSTLVNGVELISRSSLVEFIESASEPARTKAIGLFQACDYANCDWLLCLTGWSEQSIDEVLLSLMNPDTETIGGVMIEYGVGFTSGSEMESFHAIREGAPDLARSRARVQKMGQLKPWTTSSDINIQIAEDGSGLQPLLKCYVNYRAYIEALAQEFAPHVIIGLTVYGHLSHHGIDPHHRVIITAPEGQEELMASAVTKVSQAKKQLLQELLRTAQAYNCTITGGEKGIPSLLDLYRAAGWENLPPNLQQKLTASALIVKQAPPHFAFRAPADLLSL